MSCGLVHPRTMRSSSDNEVKTVESFPFRSCLMKGEKVLRNVTGEI